MRRRLGTCGSSTARTWPASSSRPPTSTPTSSGSPGAGPRSSWSTARPGADVDHVLFDNHALGRTATEELVRAGYTRIACVTGPATTPTAGERATGWRDALDAAGLPADDDLLVHANFRVDGGRDAMASLLSLPQPPDAVVATNNLVGVGVLQLVAEARDELSGMGVSVIGELPFATSAHDNLTVHPLGPREMGLTAARLLLERIAGSSEPARRLVQGAGDGTAGGVGRLRQ
ncbi:substrate-binding domain-containing protein [Georgenia sp. SUBG003]|uniref:substrate-binding domain-containing protein n=1 Tax=Georgenia sp. SUBG003 TaxID=1497974 RepID=UPI003AB667AC